MGGPDRATLGRSAHRDIAHLHSSLASPLTVIKRRVDLAARLKRLGWLGPAALVALGVVYAALDTRFPGGVEAVVTPESRVRGQALLTRALQAHGGLLTTGSTLGASVVVDDEWGVFMDRLSVWPRHSTRVDALLAVAPTRARMAFPSGELWGVEPEPWVAEEAAGTLSPKRYRAMFGGTLLVRLLLAPQVAATEGRHVVLLEEGSGARPHVLSVRLSRPNRPGHTVEWRIAVDTRSGRVVELIFPNTAAELELIERCHVEDYLDVGGLVLPARLRCTLANWVELPLHTLRVEVAARRAVTAAEFALPPKGG
jgi:hypothetical protein